MEEVMEGWTRHADGQPLTRLRNGNSDEKEPSGCNCGARSNVRRKSSRAPYFAAGSHGLFVRDRCGTVGHDAIGRRADRRTTRQFFAALPGMWIAVREETASARASSHHKRRVPQSQNHQ
jgi:hypothetical protein